MDSAERSPAEPRRRAPAARRATGRRFRVDPADLQVAAILGASIVAISLLAYYLEHLLLGGGPLLQPAQSPAGGFPVDGIECLNMEGELIHIHAYVAIYADGQAVAVPPGVGIVAPPDGDVSALASNGPLECYYALHVHDEQPSIIHVESPVRRTYTLGQLFDIWGQPLSGSQVLGYRADADHKLTFWVSDAGGTPTPYTGDPRGLPFADHRTIVILYNSPHVQPKPFDWSGFEP